MRSESSYFINALQCVQLLKNNMKNFCQQTFEHLLVPTAKLEKNPIEYALVALHFSNAHDDLLF